MSVYDVDCADGSMAHAFLQIIKLYTLNMHNALYANEASMR